MKFNILVLVVFGMVAGASADEVSHQRTAADLVALAEPEKVMKNIMLQSTEEIYARMKTQGVSDAMIAEIREATDAWFKTEVNTAELQSKLAAIYVKEYTEEELKILIAFEKSTVGQKAKRLDSSVKKQIGQAVQDQMKTKEGMIQDKIRAISQKYGK